MNDVDFCWCGAAMCGFCQHPGCGNAVCDSCVTRCECCEKDVMCPLHVDKVDGVWACLGCQKRDLDADELLERERVR